jgi:hypothetical protein
MIDAVCTVSESYHEANIVALLSALRHAPAAVRIRPALALGE